jgi:hypothetical protein
MVRSSQAWLLVGLAEVEASQLGPGLSSPVVSNGVSKILDQRPLPYQLKSQAR